MQIWQHVTHAGSNMLHCVESLGLEAQAGCQAQAKAGVLQCAKSQVACCTRCTQPGSIQRYKGMSNVQCIIVQGITEAGPAVAGGPTQWLPGVWQRLS